MKGRKINTQLAGENDFLLPFLQNLADEAQDVDPRAVRRRHLAERKRRHRERAEARRTAQKSIMSSSDLPRCLSPSMLDHQPMSPARSPTPLDQPQIKPELSYPSPATSNLDHIKLESPSPTIKQSSPAFFDFHTAFSEISDISDTELIQASQAVETQLPIFDALFSDISDTELIEASQAAETSAFTFNASTLDADLIDRQSSSQIAVQTPRSTYSAHDTRIDSAQTAHNASRYMLSSSPCHI
jgi:hypothetical protein